MNKVIIVEDDNDLREGLIRCLEMAGLVVDGVSCALDFYKKADEHDYAVAVVDIGLPDQSGLVLSEFIRDNTGMGIIILTARDSSEDWVQGYEAGADQYLVKPVRCQVLAAAVKSLLARQQTVHRSTAPAWVLDTTASALITPAGNSISLTHLELIFLSKMIEQPKYLAERDTLLIALQYQCNEHGDRALSSLVLRLRKKIKSAGVDQSPIKTAYAVGFRFAEPAEVR